MLLTTRALYFRDGKNVIVISPELGVTSWGTSVDDATRNLKEAIKLYCETARDQNELTETLEDAGYQRETPDSAWTPPALVEQQDVEVEFNEQ